MLSYFDSWQPRRTQQNPVRWRSQIKSLLDNMTQRQKFAKVAKLRIILETLANAVFLGRQFSIAQNHERVGIKVRFQELS